MKKNAFWIAVAVATLLRWGAAAAGGAEVSPSTETPPTPVVLAPQRSVPVPNYAKDSGQLALFKAINTLREQLGVGMEAKDWLGLSRHGEQPRRQLVAELHRGHRPARTLPELRKRGLAHEGAALSAIEVGTLTVKLAPVFADDRNADQLAVQKIGELGIDEVADFPKAAR